MIVILLILVIITLLMLGLYKCRNRIGDTANKLIRKMKDVLIWNAFIRYSLQSYLKLAYINIVSILVLTWSSNTKVMASIGKIVMVALCVLLPLFYMRILLKYPGIFEYDYVKLKVGSLYLGIRRRTKG